MKAYTNLIEWQNIAPYYDLYFRDRTEDIAFWVSTANRFGSPVLELACGTGRLTLPIAGAGIQITGLDISRAMLQEAKRKCKTAKPAIRENITLQFGDATKFTIPKTRFNAVFCPWGFPAATRQEQSSLMRSVRSSLLPGGHFILDVYNNTNIKNDERHFGVYEHKQFPKEKLTILRQVYSQKIAKTRLHHQLFIWDIATNNGENRRLISQRIEYMYAKSELEFLLHQYGFIIDDEYGDYDRRPWSKRSPRIIIVSHK
ncbi:MAG TPA: class I SAM-dependent methyltransferase [Patescibacteria group bacterium]|nr:class I SAM-dependent methyltransferase [Patescibacteria group bacterium]